MQIGKRRNLTHTVLKRWGIKIKSVSRKIVFSKVLGFPRLLVGKLRPDFCKNNFAAPSKNGSIEPFFDTYYKQNEIFLDKKYRYAILVYRWFRPNLPYNSLHFVFREKYNTQRAQ